MCVSAGTFLYIGAVEIMYEEFSVCKWKYRKFFTMILGLGQAIALSLVE